MDPYHVFKQDECEIIIKTFCDIDPANGRCEMCSDKIGCRLRRMADQAGKYAELIDSYRWIPVTERLPTEADGNRLNEVLAYDSDNKWCVTVYWFEVEEDKNVTHWKLMPEPGVE